MRHLAPQRHLAPRALTVEQVRRVDRRCLGCIGLILEEADAVAVTATHLARFGLAGSEPLLERKQGTGDDVRNRWISRITRRYADPD
ncbi:MAG: hypothetical protein HY560_11330 [Gemmatimonadetes bacterium]|nr:hypothetical protein [Gemmatimonadota bacterium]